MYLIRHIVVALLLCIWGIKIELTYFLDQIER